MLDAVGTAALEVVWREITAAQPALALLGPQSKTMARVAEEIAAARARGISAVDELCACGRSVIRRKPNAYDRAVGRQKPVV